MKLIRFISALTLVTTLFAVPALRADEKPWKNVTELSMVSANGNSKSTTASAKETFTYTLKKTTFELIGGGLGAKSRGVVTAEQFYGSEKVSYKVSERNYVFEKGAWDKNRFAGIKNRWDEQLGFGREVVKTTDDLLIAELGSGVVSEERYKQKTNSFSNGRAFAKYTRTLSPTATFNQDAEYILNYENPDDFRLNAETSLIAALAAHLSLKVGYKWQYVGKPPTGFGRNDTTTTIALVATY